MRNLNFSRARAATAQVSLEELVGQAERLQQAGRMAEASDLYRAWLAHSDSPARFVAHYNHGVLLAASGDLAGADAAYRHAFELNPRFHQARINAGLIAERQGQPARALQLWLDVAAEAAAIDGPIEARAFATIALNHVGRLEESRRQYAAAEAALAESLRLDPAQPDAIQHWVHVRQKQCVWPVYTPPAGMIVNQLIGATSPLAMLAMLDDPAMQWLAAETFVRRKYTRVDVRPLARQPRRDGVMRIGYLSGDLCTHAVGLLLGDLLEAHDRQRCHVTAFDFSPEDGTAHRARLLRACDETVGIHALDDATAAQVIHDRGIDVLIDLHGLSSGARPGILARRPAPHIGTYLGFIGTTALPWVDFVVTDRWTMPESVTPYVTERPLYIDGSMIPLGENPITSCRFTRESVGLRDDAVVLASFNNVYKLTPSMFACWLRILRQLPQTQLWMLDDNPWATSTLRAHAASAGIDANRLVVASRSTHAEYRQKLTLADVYLDTYPYNAGSTARDVLDAGVPLVTLSGRTPVSRMAGSLLHAAGLDELVADSVEGYERTVLTLATQPGRIRTLKAIIRDRRPEWRQVPARIVRSLEDGLQQMVESAGQP